MSASTVAVAAANPNPTPSLAIGTRRRNVSSVSEKKTTNIEMVSTQEQQQSSDRSHSNINTASVLDKPPKDLSALQINNKKVGAPVTSTASPRRSRKVVLKPPEKPRWQTVLSVFSKNFLLLLILLGLVQLIRKLTIDGAAPTTTTLPSAGVADFEGRIAEVDSLLKKTTKMMQVQLEVVDKKIETEVGGVRRDLIKKFDEKGSFFESRLKELEARTDGLDKSFSELRSYKFLTKDDLQRFSDELKDRTSPGGSDLSLDEIRAVAREIVEKEIERHAADGLSRADYALASGGARVVSYSETHSHMSNGYWFNLARRRTTETAAQKMLQPSFGEPGHCFALKGSNGFVVIRLRQPIVPDAFTLEHVAKSVAYDRSSAPKDCRITGWLRHENSVQSSRADEQFLLAEFTYDLERSNAQTFNVESKDSRIIDMVRLDFTSNHGASHTCIYRLRVHGHEPDLVPISALQP